MCCRGGTLARKGREARTPRSAGRQAAAKHLFRPTPWGMAAQWHCRAAGAASLAPCLDGANKQAGLSQPLRPANEPAATSSPAQVHSEDAGHHGAQGRRKRGDGQQQLQAVDLRRGGGSTLTPETAGRLANSADRRRAQRSFGAGRHDGQAALRHDGQQRCGCGTSWTWPEKRCSCTS